MEYRQFLISKSKLAFAYNQEVINEEIRKAADPIHLILAPLFLYL